MRKKKTISRSPTLEVETWKSKTSFELQDSSTVHVQNETKMVAAPRRSQVVPYPSTDRAQ